MKVAGEALSEASKRPGRVMLVVGEASGDLYGAQLVQCLHRREPGLEIFGVAGERLKGTGIQVVFDVARLSGMGLAELIGNLRTVWQAHRLLQGLLRKNKPDLLILIDFPEFNLRLARSAKQLNIPVLYYISPQVWAWRRHRTRRIAHWVSQMAVVFPFEVPLYEKEGARVTFVGHPLLELVHAGRSREVTLERYGLDPNKKTIALLPGSRKREVEYLLPVMLRAAQRMNRDKGTQFILCRASTVERQQLQAVLSSVSVPVPIAEEDTYNVINGSDFAWVASGTATLETALLQKPMVVVYRLSWITYVLARLLVRVDHVGMVNIVAGERIVPELIQGELTEDSIIDETERILGDPKRYRQIAIRLGEVRERLGDPGAPQRVADIAFSLLYP